MADYTVQVQRSFDAITWTPVSKPETVEDVTDIRASLGYIAGDQYIDEPKAVWRVCAWPGRDADATAEPAAIAGPFLDEVRELEDWATPVGAPVGPDPDGLLEELAVMAFAMDLLSARRDILIKALMRLKPPAKVARGAIAEAAGVSVPRLNQIAPSVKSG
jgi:hypothetical protein